MNGLSKAVERLKDYWDRSRDNFGRNVSNELSDIIELPGEKEFTPERYRYFKDGERRFLMYGDDDGVIDAAILRGSAPVPVDGEATDVTPNQEK